jgi:tetratricopeptide (TPR) repeat protein
MLGASAYFAFKIYEHIQTLQEPDLSADDTPPPLPDSEVDELIQDGDEARERGDLDRALAIYSEAKINQPQNAEILFKMGYTMSELERYEEALEYFERSYKIQLEMGDKVAGAYSLNNIGFLYNQQKDYAKILEFSKKNKYKIKKGKNTTALLIYKKKY